jgi:hypothetical protein
MINSFNEWHEDTQIEPTVVAQRTNVDDSGLQQYTEGHFYAGYGNLYLNILRSATTLAGDFNHDGVVDVADYVVWRKSGSAADDYNTWRANFGRTLPAGGAVPNDVYATRDAEPQSPVVPEPTTIFTLLVGILLVDLRWRLSVSSLHLLTAHAKTGPI